MRAWNGKMVRDKKAMDCSVCGRWIVLTKRGRVHWHKVLYSHTREYCEGSREPIKLQQEN